MKKIFSLYFLISSAFSYSAVRKIPDYSVDSKNFRNYVNQSEKNVFHMVLFQRGKMLCVVSVGKFSHLFPPFLIASPNQGEISFNLPECSLEDKNIVQGLTQRAVLLDERGESQVAVGPVALIIGLCTLGGLSGHYVQKWQKKMGKKIRRSDIGFTGESPIGLTGGVGGLMSYGLGGLIETLDKTSKGFSVVLKHFGIFGMCFGIGSYADYVIGFFN